jgi:hypothetical protein
MIGGAEVPGGTTVGSSIYAVQHNAAVFERPWEYDVRRWVGGDAQQQQQQQRAWVPFSVGPRQCVAKKFALMEVQLAMARAVWSFDFRAADGGAGAVGEGGRGGSTARGWVVSWAERLLGLGLSSRVPRGRERKGEFQMAAHFTSAVEGPMIRFKRKEA